MEGLRGKRLAPSVRSLGATNGPPKIVVVVVLVLDFPWGATPPLALKKTEDEDDENERDDPISDADGSSIQ
jgi:hypothetical protein